MIKKKKKQTQNYKYYSQILQQYPNMHLGKKKFKNNIFLPIFIKKNLLFLFMSALTRAFGGKRNTSKGSEKDGSPPRSPKGEDHVTGRQRSHTVGAGPQMLRLSEELNRKLGSIQQPSSSGAPRVHTPPLLKSAGSLSPRGEGNNSTTPSAKSPVPIHGRKSAAFQQKPIKRKGSTPLCSTTNYRPLPSPPMKTKSSSQETVHATPVSKFSKPEPPARNLTTGVRVPLPTSAALWQLVYSGDTAGILRLLKSNSSFVDCQDADGSTPLTFSADTDNYSMATVLLKCGANPMKASRVIFFSNLKKNFFFIYLCMILI